MAINGFMLFWAERVQKNPSLADEDIKIGMTVASFKKQQEKAFNAGRDRQLLLDKGKKGSVDDLFGGLFR